MSNIIYKGKSFKVIGLFIILYVLLTLFLIYKGIGNIVIHLFILLIQFLIVYLHYAKSVHIKIILKAWIYLLLILSIVRFGILVSYLMLGEKEYIQIFFTALVIFFELYLVSFIERNLIIKTK